MRAVFLLISLLFTLSFTGGDPGDKPYPRDYFAAPVKTTLLLSGTFGELRSNHFHMGIDIKGSIGTPLYAAAEGYVSRISVDAGGYGRALYIAHPSGYTTVYAHMNRFADRIEEYVKKTQYEQERFEVDLSLPAGLFAFHKGDRIGDMGTTGYSFGPHLHFEIRDSKTEVPVNPLLFGLKPQDHLPPRMHQIKVYALDEGRRTLDARTYDLIGKGRTYRIAGDTVFVDSDWVGLALKAYDHMNGANNWNGIYTAELRVDRELYYQFEMERIPFEETRYINAHLDYADQVSRKSYFNRLFALPGNGLGIYPGQIEAGVIRLPTDPHAREIRISAHDAAGNLSELRFWIKRSGRTVPEEMEDYQYLLAYDESHEFHSGTLSLQLPKGSLYEDLYLNYRCEVPPADRGIYSLLHHLHNYKTPVHQYFDLGIQPTSLPENLRTKAFIAYVSPGGYVVSCGGEWRQGMLWAEVRQLGDFCIMVDEEAPRIVPVNFKSDMQGAVQMTFKIVDNFGISGYARGLQFRATVDGEWILMEHDAKNDLLFHRFDGRIKPGRHQFRLEVWDNQENRAIMERPFIL